MNKVYIYLLLFFLLPLTKDWAQGNNIYKLKSGNVVFYSHSSQELIHASSNQLRGAIDLRKKTFAFKLSIVSFVGFNSELQREHFNENYMETSIFPDATYVGKIIEDIDMLKDGAYDVRTKGKLKIHGVEQERIIKSHITCKDGTITIQSDFNVLLSDYNIKIPRVVDNKISNNINVSVDAIFAPST